jgi:hypothetical protein
LATVVKLSNDLLVSSFNLSMADSHESISFWADAMESLSIVEYPSFAAPLSRFLPPHETSKMAVIAINISFFIAFRFLYYDAPTHHGQPVAPVILTKSSDSVSAVNLDIFFQFTKNYIKYF